jgi:hypothetical protein
LSSNIRIPEFDPLDGEEFNFVLHRTSDCQDSNHAENALIALRVGDFYVGFNGAAGIFENIVGDRNNVTVIWRDGGGEWEYGLSWKVASLAPGQHYEIEKYDKYIDVIVELNDLIDGEASIQVSTCQDVAEDLKFQLKDGKKKNCKYWAKKGKCDSKIKAKGKDKGMHVKEI